jgi:hypothetical protein
MGQGKGVIKKNIHRLGNLIILPASVNSQCGTKAFSDKKQLYKGVKFHHVDDVVFKNYVQQGDQEEQLDWGVEEIKDREERLLQWAREIWFD